MPTVAERLSTALADRYRIERELGGGGMSRVFVAEETALGRQVVIKVVAPDLVEGVSGERFAREVKLAARLQQANIVPVLAAGVADGMPYYTMPFVRGEPLRARLTHGRSQTINEVVGILRDVARALGYAHAEGIVHRDIKPENILLSSGAAVVTDFGIAKAISAARGGADRPEGDSPKDLPEVTLTFVGSSIGTPAYMAPEQAAGDPGTDHRADIYAWGVVAWELLAGRHPFAAATTPQALLAAHLAQTPPDVASARADVPPTLAGLVGRCLEKDPAQRPASAAELLHGLDEVTTPPASPRGEVHPRPASAGRRRGWILAAAAVLAGTAGGGWWAMRSRGLGATVAANATRTIVVMPFDNLGADRDAYFVQGVSEEIASRLGQIPGIRVVGRASAARLKGANKSNDEIARALGADFVLTGSVRWDRASGSADPNAAVRITPALLRASTGERLWGEALTERLTDVFKVQGDVAERVAIALSVNLGGATRATLRRVDSQDPEARDATLLGFSLVARRGAQNIRAGVAQFRRALARDSTYARAWAGLAEALAVQPIYAFDTDPSSASPVTTFESLQAAERAARRAVALDSLAPEAWSALATTLQFTARYQEALRAADRAVALDPSSAQALSRRGMGLLGMGRVAEAEAPLKQAAMLDPLVGAYVSRLAYWHIAAGQPDSAIRYIERSLGADPANTILAYLASQLYAQIGHLEDAVRLCTVHSRNAASCRATYAGLLDPAQRRNGIALLDSHGAGGGEGMLAMPIFRALGYAHLGETDKAFVALREAIDQHDGFFLLMINSPWLAPLRADPRWDAIVGAAQRQ